MRATSQVDPRGGCLVVGDFSAEPHPSYNPGVATQRLFRQSVDIGRVRDSRPADSLVQIISILGARRRELKASVGERLMVLGARTSAFESRHVQLEERLVSAEGHLEQLGRARVEQSVRIVHLRDQLQILRRGEVGQDRAPHTAMHRLGSALMYVGGLLLLWVVLLELGLAFGLT
jgi:hypothetical protein